MRNHDFTNVFWNDFTPKSVAMFVTWYYWSFGFCTHSEELWLANFFEMHCVSQEHGIVFLFWKQGLFGSLWAAKKKSISKFQNLQCKRVCNPWVSNTLAVYLDLLPILDFFLESFFLVFSGGGGGCSSSSLSSSSPCPSSSSLFSLSLAPAEPSFRLANELGPLLVVALGAGSTLGVVLPTLSSSSLSSSPLLPSELSLSPSYAYISTCKA